MHVHFLVASRQLWPNIFGLLLLRQQNRFPDRIHILHSGNERESAQPAKRLEKLVRSHLGRNTFCERHPIDQETPEAVTALIERLCGDLPAGCRKTINATGGLKAIFAGLVAFFDRPDFEVLYNEIVGGWHRLWIDGDRPGYVRSEPLPSTSVLADSLPAMSLVETQWDDVPAARWRGAPAPRVTAREWEGVLRDGFARGWNWIDLRTTHPWLVQNGRTQTGFLFESLFGGLLGLFPLASEQIAINAELVAFDPPGRVLEEIDAVVNTGRNLVLFDLKLRSEEEETRQNIAVVDQFSKVSKACDMLGGLGAKGILVRPNWPRNEEHQQLARAFRVELWDQNAMSGLLGHVARTIGLAIPPELAGAVDLLREEAEHHSRFFASAPWLPRGETGMATCEEVESLPGLLDVSRYLQSQQQNGQGAWIRLHGGQAIFVVSKTRVVLECGQLQPTHLVFPQGAAVPVRAMIPTKSGVSITYLLDTGGMARPGALAELQRAMIAGGRARAVRRNNGG